MANLVRDLRIQIDDLTAEQKRADQDVEQVKTRRERDQGMIDAGQVKDPKALERMLGELQSLHRRINSLEDVELEVMERLETAQTAFESRTDELAAMEGEETELRAAFQQKAGDLQNELSAAQEEGRAERATTAAGCRQTCWRSTRSCGHRRTVSGLQRCVDASARVAGSP